MCSARSSHVRRGRGPRWRGAADACELEYARSPYRVPARRQGQDQARHLPPVRQRALPTGQPERPIGSRADAESPELHQEQRHARHERPHGPDLAHGRRHPELADGSLPRPARTGGLELVQLLPARTGRSGFSSTLQVLDRLDRRRQPGEQSADRRRPTRTSTCSTPTRPSLGGTGRRRATPRRRGCRTHAPGATSAMSASRTRCSRTTTRSSSAPVHDACGSLGSRRDEHQGREPSTNLAAGQTINIEPGEPRAGDDRIGRHGRRGRHGRHPHGGPHEGARERRHAQRRFATDPTGDMTKVFGAGSPEWNDGKASQIAVAGTAARAKAQTDYVGIAIHCAQGTGSICNGNANAKNDPLPDEAGPSGGRGRVHRLQGASSARSTSTRRSTAARRPSTTRTGRDIRSSTRSTQPGFPGFDGMYAKNTLGEVAQMQEHGVPVTFAYISDAHDFHGNSGNTHVAYGPGEAGYVQQLKDYDKAFGDFFTRLEAATGSRRTTRSSSSPSRKAITSPARRPTIRPATASPRRARTPTATSPR